MRDELPTLVSTEWLGQCLGRPGLRVVDGSWYLPASGRDPAAEYLAGHIPGAVFFDLDASSDRNTSLPHMLPAAHIFAERMASLGLSDRDDLVIYDGSGINLSAPRVWWTFRIFGHDRVAVLDGGMGKWRAENRPVDVRPVKLPRGSFTARLSADGVRDLKAVQANLTSRTEQLVDVRSAARFAGVEPEPRPGVRAGHVPGSRNLPFTDLLAPDGTMLRKVELQRRIEAAGIDLALPIVATCGSGTSACALILALHLLDRRASVYDGAWTEWGGRQDTPVAAGPPLEG